MQHVNSQFLKLMCWNQEKYASVRVWVILTRAKLWWLDDWVRVWVILYQTGFFISRMAGPVPGKEMAAGCTMGRRQAGRDSVMFCWETLSPGLHVAVAWTRATYLNIVADHIHPLTATVFPGSGLFQQDRVPWLTAKMVQEWFKEHDKEFRVLTWPANSPDLNPNKHLWGMIHGGPLHNLQDFEDLLLMSCCPDTIGHLQRSCGVHASTG